MPVWSDFGAAVFVDAGNVFERVTQIDVCELRATAGFGMRYRSPVGPLRFDVGFKTRHGGITTPRRAGRFISASDRRSESAKGVRKGAEGAEQVRGVLGVRRCMRR